LASIFRGEDPFEELVKVCGDLAPAASEVWARPDAILTEIPLTFPAASRCRLDFVHDLNLRAAGSALFGAAASTPGLLDFATANWHSSFNQLSEFWPTLKVVCGSSAGQDS
jgi:hypothetical protein